MDLTKEELIEEIRKTELSQWELMMLSKTIRKETKNLPGILHACDAHLLEKPCPVCREAPLPWG